MVRLGALAQLAAMGLAGRDAVRVLWTGGTLAGSTSLGLPFCPGAFALDPLSAVFVAATALVGLAIAVYAPSYLEKAGHRMTGACQQALLSLLLASILGVLVAADVVGFLIAWELMAVLATALILADGDRGEVKRAAILYIVLTHAATFLAIAGWFVLLGDARDLSFEAFRAGASGRPAWAHALGVSLVLVGFGTKAGIVPLHVWLPEAHPVAPSHVSALLSGVIVKVGIYGILRTVLDLAGPPPAWVGYAILTAGLTSAILGVLYALLQHDLKRLLAFHTVENVGIILLGAGLSIVARHAGLPVVASLALAAGLFHVVNHAVFKGLLFLCAGSVHLGTHTRDLEEMGGLAARMPSTARAFLVGALAISALPPLNGFASEWLILQGFIASAHAEPGLLRTTAPLLAGGLALTGALAAACFVKAFAVAFLALPRSSHAEQAVEAAAGARWGQNGLALACIVLGLASPWIAGVLTRPGHALDPSVPAIAPGAVLGGGGLATVQPIALAALGLAVGLGGWLVLLRGGRPRRALTWACGLGVVEGRATYTASAFADPIRRIFANVYRSERTVEPVEGIAPYFVRRSRTHVDVPPFFERYLYQPAVRTLHAASEALAAWSIPSVNFGLFLFAVFLAIVVGWAAW